MDFSPQPALIDHRDPPSAIYRHRGNAFGCRFITAVVKIFCMWGFVASAQNVQYVVALSINLI